MVEVFGEIGVVVLLLVVCWFVVVGVGFQEQQVLVGYQLVLVEGEWQLVGRCFVVYCWLVYQVGVQGFQVFVVSFGEGGVRECWIQVVVVVGYVMLYGLFEGGVGLVIDVVCVIWCEVVVVDCFEWCW